MNSFLAVFKRELKGYFTTPLAYVFLFIFLFFSGYLTFRQGFYAMRQADMRTFFMNLPLLFVFMVPSTAMRLWDGGAEGRLYRAAVYSSGDDNTGGSGASSLRRGFSRVLRWR